ncbi:hypothetical protein LPJ56_000480 [Coemansia sp. RSA 2599]|nr:hypothetical protein LPJ56_000480 [Coemansia sp. RSA 2599]
MPDLASVLNRANDPRSGDGCEDMVLSKSVTDLCISIARINGAYKSGMDDEEEMVVACCTYLILLMPNLHNVFINRPINWSLQDIVDDLADEFPHLSRLGD